MERALRRGKVRMNTVPRFLRAGAAGLLAAGLLLAASVFILDRTGRLPLPLLKSKFISAPERLSRESALRDSGEFFFRLERVHPDHTFTLGPAGYEELKRRTADEIKEKAGKNGWLSVREFAYILQRSAAAVGDGHTLLRYSYEIDAEDARPRFPPFTLENKDGRLVISPASGGQYAGAELVAINGTPFKEFIRPIMERISGETFKFKAHLFELKQWFWWDFSGLLAGLGSFEAELRYPDGKVTTARFGTAGPQGIPLGRTRKQGSGASLSLYHKNKIGWLNYASFEFSEAQKNELTGIFKKLNAEGIRDLVIDLRGNTGGNSGMGDFIFSRISRAGVVQTSGRIKVSEEFIKIFPRLEEFRHRVGTVIEMGKQASVAVGPDEFFDGRVYLLTDNGSYSSSNLFAAAFRDYKLGTIIGYETGEPPIAFGNIVNLALPESGIEYGISACKYFPPKPRPGDDKRGVIPDVVLNDGLLRPYGGRAQAFVLDYIVRERKGKKG